MILSEVHLIHGQLIDSTCRDN